MIKEIEDLRPKYAALLREMAERVEQSNKQPQGCFVEIFLIGGELVRARTLEDGFNLMHAVGCMEIVKTDLCNEILVRQKKI